jgi:hypothetical protein
VALVTSVACVFCVDLVARVALVTSLAWVVCVVRVTASACPAAPLVLRHGVPLPQASRWA